MAGKQPSEGDRLVAHAIVGVGTGLAVGKKSGFAGFIVGAIVGIFAHAIFDAPLATVIAEIT